MNYSIQLSILSVSDFKSIILGKELLPARRFIVDNIDDVFLKIQSLGIDDLQKLKSTLNNSKKLCSLAEHSGISMEYLTVLKRELHALEQSPVLLSDFGIMDGSVIDILTAQGIRTSRDYYERAGNIKLDDYTQSTLSSLCDLVRVNGIGTAAAKAFFAAGYQSVKDIADGEAEDMLERISQENSKRQFYSGRLGIKDMQYCIDNAKLLLRFSR